VLATQINDLREIRKKKKRKNFFKRAAIVMFIFLTGLILFLTRNNWLPVFDGILYKYRSSVNKDDVLKNFPLKVATGNSFDLITLDDKVVLLSDTNLTKYNRDGEVSSSQQHGMSNPITKSENGRLFVYDLGYSKFIVENRSGNIITKTITDKIVYGEISSKGYVAIVSRSDSYSSLLTIYNEKGDKIFYSYLKEKILNIAFNKKSNGCIASTISAQGGQMISKLYSFNFNIDKA